MDLPFQIKILHIIKLFKIQKGILNESIIKDMHEVDAKCLHMVIAAFWLTGKLSLNLKHILQICCVILATKLVMVYSEIFCTFCILDDARF